VEPGPWIVFGQQVFGDEEYDLVDGGNLPRLKLMMAAGLASVLASSMANAATFGPKTMQKDLPARDIDRTLHMAKGWVEFALGYDHKVGTGAWGADGSRNPFESAKWTYQTEHLTVRYGLAPRTELWWYAEYHQARLFNEALGTDTRDHGLGDQQVGYRYSIYERSAPGTSIVFETSMKMPSGKEAPGTYIGGPLNVSGFVFTTGTTDLYAGFGAKYTAGPIAFTGRAGYNRRFSGVVNYLIEVEQYQFQGRIKPGDQIMASVDVMAQLGPIALSVTPKMEYRMATKQGTSSGGLFPARRLRKVPQSDGLALDLESRFQFQVNRNLDLEFYTNIPLVGQDLQFFPIEDIHPTLGPTFGGAVEVRY
jgi:hypothetical protein